MSGLIFQRKGRPYHNFAATADPGVTNDSGQGYGVGSKWFDVTHSREWTCFDATAGAAVWVVKNPTLVFQSSLLVAHTGDTAETILATCAIPGSAIGKNGFIRAEGLWSNNNSGNNKTARIRFSGIGGTAIGAPSVNTTNLGTHDVRMLGNANSESAQRYYSPLSPWSANTSAASTTTLAVDTTAATTLLFTGQLANSGDTINLDMYQVQVFYAP